MNYRMIIAAVVTAAWVGSAVAQTLPGAPEDNGMAPKTGTIYVNSQEFVPETINNTKTESLGVAVANNGNVIVGWEDDGSDLTDLEAVWTLYDSAGTSITPNTPQNALSMPGLGYITNKFLSYFRADKTAVVGATSWGPKIKANLFGDGVGMGAISFALGLEVAEFAAWEDWNQGDAPSVQLLANDGQPVNVVAGVSAAYATSDPGDIRIGDWDYLSNGNIVIADESRQNGDLVTVYGGTDAYRHIVFRIVSPAGAVVKAETLVSETANQTANAEMWHGVGVTKNGFAVRFKAPNGRATVRMFDNAGTPTSTNIDLGTLSGHEEAAGGGRGDGVGFHGNGKDAYVSVNGSGNTVWVTVLSTNGTVRFSKSVADDLTLTSVGRTDAAIDPDGKVVVVFDAKYDPANAGLVMGRWFNAAGTPQGRTFYASEKELPDPATATTGGPRVAWNKGLVAVAWESQNDMFTINPNTGYPAKVVALRLFSTFVPGSIESVGLTRIVPDTPLIVPQNGALGNWEPYASVLGTSTFLIEGNTFANGFDAPSPDGKQRYVVALQPAAGGAMRLGEGFYGDDGLPYNGAINDSRQNGNPGRSAGDRRPGATTFVIGGEASPHAHPTVFGSDNRWNLGFDRLFDGRYGTIQTYCLNPTTLSQTPLCKAQDSANGRLTSGVAGGNQTTRFGGDVAFLDNGNFVSVVEDRTLIRSPKNCITATIFAPNGTVVKDSWTVVASDTNDREIWSNVTSYKGGFAVRCQPQDPALATQLIYFYDNAGNLQGTVDQATSGIAFNASRGDGTRIFGHINSPYVYLAGRPPSTVVVQVAAFDSRTRRFVAATNVNEGAFTGNFDRVFGASDALDRLTVGWVSQPVGYEKQQVAARVFSFDGTKFSALTRSFFPFINVATNQVRSLQMSVAMTTRQICVAAKGEINLQNHPELGTNSPVEVNFYTVFSHPAPANDPTTAAPLPQFTKVQLIPGPPKKLHLEWTGCGGTLQVRDDVATGTWTDIAGATSPYDLTIDRTKRFVRIKQ